MRVQQENIRTVLRGIGCERDYVFANGKLRKRDTNQRQNKGDNENRQPNQTEGWRTVNRNGFRGRGRGRRGRFH